METKGKILVIDDEIGICKGCQRALEPQGYFVETALTIEDGLSKIMEREYDLILLDVMMPNGRGIDLLGVIHEKDPDLICVIITGYATVELAVKAIRLGAYDFISKPFTSDTLLMTVDQGLEKRRLALEAKRLQNIEQIAIELAREKEEMERLDQFKSSFMLTIAHELRAPVAGALSMLRIMIRGLAGEVNEKQIGILKRIETRLTILLLLVNDLLSLAANKTVELDKPLVNVSLPTVLRHVIEHYSVEAEEKHHTMTSEIPTVNIFVQGTEDGFITVFSNLISNAIKYTPEGGRIRVSLAVLGDEASVSVADTGIGIPDEDQTRLGEEFFRAKTARATEIIGTGLGLSIVKQIIDHFGGHMDVHSKVGQGTTFLVTLPLADALVDKTLTESKNKAVIRS